MLLPNYYIMIISTYLSFIIIIIYLFTAINIHTKCYAKFRFILASSVVVLVGASPNLEFLEDQGCNLGIVLDKPISRKNVVDTNLFSQEIVRQTGI